MGANPIPAENERNEAVNTVYGNSRFPSNVPIVVPRPKQMAADLVDEVLQKLRATKDPDREAELLSLGIDILRRRQADHDRAGRRVR